MTGLYALSLILSLSKDAIDRKNYLTIIAKRNNSLLKKRFSQLRSSIICLSFLFISGCFDAKELALGTLEWDRINGRAVASENITHIFVKEGDYVSKGQALLKINDSLQLALVHKLSATVDQARWQLTQYEAGYREEDIAQARANLEAKTIVRKNNETNYHRQKRLRRQGVNTQKQLDDAREIYEASKSEEKIAQESLNEMNTGYRVEQIEAAKATLASSIAELEYQQLQLKRYTVVAHRAGKVDSFPYKLGDKPPMNAVLTTVLAGDKPWARVYLPEAWLGLVSQGSEALLTVDGISSAFKGRIRFISSVASFTPYYALSENDRSRLMFVAEIDLLEETAKKLPLGIPVQMLHPSRIKHPRNGS
jgi:HlyD family secretion protein